jgi:hypothetical protein
MLLSPKLKRFFLLTQLLLLGESLPVSRLVSIRTLSKALQTEIFDVLPLMMINKALSKSASLLT